MNTKTISELTMMLTHDNAAIRARAAAELARRNAEAGHKCVL